MADNTYTLIGGPHKGEGILIFPNGKMFVVDVPGRIEMQHDGDGMTVDMEMAGRPLTSADVYTLAQQRFAARSLLARCLPLVVDAELRREIKATLEEETDA